MEAALPMDVKGMKIRYVADYENVVDESNNVLELLIRAG